MKNVFAEIFDFDAIKKEMAKMQTVADEVNEIQTLMLIPCYSINIARKYNDAEDADQINWDWDEMEERIGTPMHVNDYDDLCVSVYPENYEGND